MKILALLSLTTLIACAAPRAVEAPNASAGSHEGARSDLAAAPAATQEGEKWHTSLDRAHALVGKIWDNRSAAFISATTLADRARSARFVLLGERHDNPDHHRLQARVITDLVRAGRRPAVVLEMLELPQQPSVDRYVSQPGATAAGLGAAVEWEHTGWPPFHEYQPIFEAAFAAKLPIIAGNVAHADVKAIVKQGASALGSERVKALRLEQPFPPELEASLIEELRASHCGQLPESLLAPMAVAQHARDAQMALALAGADARSGAVLIAGSGHVRLDRGVPYYLASAATGASVVSIAFREVRSADTDPRAYALDEGPFDYSWFTPRATDADPCADFHK